MIRYSKAHKLLSVSLSFASLSLANARVQTVPRREADRQRQRQKEGEEGGKRIESENELFGSYPLPLAALCAASRIKH